MSICSAVEIKSKYMQSATKRKTPAVGKTPSTVSNLNQTAKTGSANKSNRQKIDEVRLRFAVFITISEVYIMKKS